MPTFSRTTCNGVTVEPEAGVVDTPHVHTHTHTLTHTNDGKKSNREKSRSYRLDSRNSTNYLAIRWQRAPNLQVFTLHSTPSRSLTLPVHTAGEGEWISSVRFFQRQTGDGGWMGREGRREGEKNRVNSGKPGEIADFSEKERENKRTTGTRKREK